METQANPMYHFQRKMRETIDKGFVRKGNNASLFINNPLWLQKGKISIFQFFFSDFSKSCSWRQAIWEREIESCLWVNAYNFFVTRKLRMLCIENKPPKFNQIWIWKNISSGVLCWESYWALNGYRWWFGWSAVCGEVMLRISKNFSGS